MKGAMLPVLCLSVKAKIQIGVKGVLLVMVQFCLVFFTSFLRKLYVRVFFGLYCTGLPFINQAKRSTTPFGNAISLYFLIVMSKCGQFLDLGVNFSSNRDAN